MLESHHLFGPILLDWQENGAIATRFKVMALTMMAATFAVSVYFELPLFVLIVQAVCMLGASSYILTRPSRGVRSTQSRG